MTSLSNLRRDMWWSPEVVAVAQGSNFAYNADPYVANPNVGYERHGAVESGRISSLGGTAGTDWRAYGVAMTDLTEADTTVFRVKGHCSQDSTDWGVGFVSTLSADVQVTNPRFFGRGDHLDEVVAVRYPTSGATEYAVFFGMTRGGASNFNMIMTVQNLLGHPDTYSAQVT